MAKDLSKTRVVPKICPSAEILWQCFTYDKQSGEIFWKKRPVHHFSRYQDFLIWNGRFPGRRAGSQKKRGFWVVSISQEIYTVHRLIWVMHHGYLPESLEIDHVNGDPSDNRIENLRAVSHTINGRNQKKNRRNTSGFTGVSWSKQKGRWCARAGSGRGKNGKLTRTLIGFFDSVEEAGRARMEYQLKNGYTDRHGL